MTDHRIGADFYKLDIVLNGEMDELLDALLTAKQSEQLQQVEIIWKINPYGRLQGFWNGQAVFRK